MLRLRKLYIPHQPGPSALCGKKINRKGNTKFFARPTGIIRAGKDHKEI